MRLVIWISVNGVTKMYEGTCIWTHVVIPYIEVIPSWMKMEKINVEQCNEISFENISGGGWAIIWCKLGVQGFEPIVKSSLSTMKNVNITTNMGVIGRGVFHKDILTYGYYFWEGSQKHMHIQIHTQKHI